MRTTGFLKLSFAACLAAIFVTATAEAQPPGGGQRGQDGRGQRGQGQRGPGGGGGSQRGGGFQRGGGGFGGFTITKSRLLAVEDVLDDLKVDEGQGETIKAALESYRGERDASRPSREDFDKLSEEERAAKRAELQKKSEELSKKTNEILVSLLTDEQAKRLEQIELQIQLRFGLTRYLKSDEGRKQLSITDEQIAKLDAAQEEADQASTAARSKAFEAFRANRGEGGGDGGQRPDFNALREKMSAQMAELRKASEKKVAAILTEDQNRKLAELKGDPFEFDTRALFGRGGRSGGGGGGNFGGGRGRPGEGGGRGRGEDGGRGRGRGEDGGRGRGQGGERRRPAIEDDAV